MKPSSETNIRRRISHLEAQVKHEREQHISRALGYQQSDPRRAAYHTGLADGCNSVLVELRRLMREYPDGHLHTVGAS